MAKLTTTLKGDKVIFNIVIESSDQYKNWCVVVSSKSNYGRGFDVPARSKIFEYLYKVDKFCGKGSQSIQKDYLMPGEYLAMLGLASSEEMINKVGTELIDISTELIMTKFEISGQSITDKDVNSAKEILSCLAEIFDKNKKKGEPVFDNMMIDPMLSIIVEMMNSIANKKTIYPYVDIVKNRIDLIGPTINEGKYFWPILKEGKFHEYIGY
jgi:hypothetical protein